MAKLKRLKIEKFRNVETTELPFGVGFNVLLGLNGTGKTTLLGLVAAVLSSDFSGMREEPFAIEYEIGLREGTITASVRNEEAEQAPLVMMGTIVRRTGSAAWRQAAHATL